MEVGSNGTENRGYFAGEGAEAEAAAAEFGGEFHFTKKRLEDFAEEAFVFGEAPGVGMIRNFPVGEQALACDGVFPKESAIFEPGDVAKVRIFSPRLKEVGSPIRDF